MLRYCTHCQKDFDFSPAVVSRHEPLICPECGSVVGYNSKNPARIRETEKADEAIAGILAAFLHMAWIFYMFTGVLGIAGFFLKQNMLLYTATVISLSVFAIQLVTGTLIFTSGILFLPIGVFFGYLHYGSLEGACLGIHLVFVIRHLIRDLCYMLLTKLIRMTGDRERPVRPGSALYRNRLSSGEGEGTADEKE